MGTPMLKVPSQWKINSTLKGGNSMENGPSNVESSIPVENKFNIEGGKFYGTWALQC